MIMNLVGDPKVTEPVNRRFRFLSADEGVYYRIFNEISKHTETQHDLLRILSQIDPNDTNKDKVRALFTLIVQNYRQLLPGEFLYTNLPPISSIRYIAILKAIHQLIDPSIIKIWEALPEEEDYPIPAHDAEHPLDLGQFRPWCENHPTLANITTISVVGQHLVYIPLEIDLLVNLIRLNLSYNVISHVPPAIQNLG